MSNRTVVRIDGKVLEEVRKIAGKRDEDLGETLDAIISTGVSRLAALSKYAKKTAPRRARKSAKKKAKRKAKGPHARRSKKKQATAAKFKPMKRRAKRPDARKRKSRAKAEKPEVKPEQAAAVE